MSMKTKTKIHSRLRRKKHIRKRLKGTADRPRLAVYRSLNHLYAQLIDDDAEKSLFTVSDLSPEIKSQVKDKTKKVEKSALIGDSVAKKLKEKKIETIVFDRSGYRYHGRVKALAEAARKAGLKF